LVDMWGREKGIVVVSEHLRWWVRGTSRTSEHVSHHEQMTHLWVHRV